MKDDTDYRRKYEDALERAREMCAMPTDKATMEYVFPELKEDEDRRIKTFIKGLLLLHISDVHVVGDEIKPNKDIDIYRKALAWLEKQNERPTTINVDKMVDEFEHSKVMSRGIPSLAEVDAYRKGVTDALSKILIREEKDC